MQINFIIATLAQPQRIQFHLIAMHVIFANRFFVCVFHNAMWCVLIADFMRLQRHWHVPGIPFHISVEIGFGRFRMFNLLKKMLKMRML